MAEVIDVKAPAAESKETAPVEVKVETKGEGKSVAELLGTDKPEPKMVPESQLLEYKKEVKGLKKELDRVQDMIAEGATKKEVNNSLKAISEKHNVSEDFLNELARAIRAETDADIDEKVDAKMKPLTKKERESEIDRVFSENFSKTIDQMPEYKDIANREVIKALTLDSANQNKTFAQILEMAYGHFVQGKRTLDEAKPRGGREPAAVDFDKAQKDNSYFKEIMANPELKKEYNANLAKRLRL